MKHPRITAFLIGLALWEAYWLYVYMTATIPDEEMAMLAAILFGGIIPTVVVAFGSLGILLFRVLIKQRF